MTKYLTTLVVFALLFAAPAPSHAAWMCFNASQADIGATSTCTRETGITADDRAVTKVRCTASGTDNYLVFNATVPYDMTATPTFLGAELDFQNGGSVSGTNVCWSYGAWATLTGQDFETPHIVTDFQTSFPATAYPSTTTTATAINTADFVLDDMDGVDCDGTCRGRPLRIAVYRNNAACGTPANAGQDFIKLCLEY